LARPRATPTTAAMIWKARHRSCSTSSSAAGPARPPLALALGCLRGVPGLPQPPRPGIRRVHDHPRLRRGSRKVRRPTARIVCRPPTLTASPGHPTTTAEAQSRFQVGPQRLDHRAFCDRATPNPRRRHRLPGPGRLPRHCAPGGGAASCRRSRAPEGPCLQPEPRAARPVCPAARELHHLLRQHWCRRSPAPASHWRRRRRPKKGWKGLKASPASKPARLGVDPESNVICKCERVTEVIRSNTHTPTHTPGHCAARARSDRRRWSRPAGAACRSTPPRYGLV
jgi:hypothetical protein